MNENAVRCPACSAAVHPEDAACRVCGRTLAEPTPPPDRPVRPTRHLVLLVVAAIVALACIGGGLAAIVATASRAESPTSGLIRPTSTPGPGGIFEANQVRNPYSAVPLGSPVRIRIGNRELLLTVASVKHDAFADLIRLGVVAPPPDPNFEYVLIRLKVQYLSGPAGGWTIPPLTQEVMAQGQTWGRTAIAPPPPPPFSGVVLNGPGATHEGYLSPALVPKAGQADAVLSLQIPGAGGEVWLRLS
ncbi:MAG: hypothetical protein U0556_18060 [Dehalococcoidia bacterium]